MASTTRVVLLERMSVSIGDWQSLTASSNGNAGGTTIIDTELANLPGGGVDDGIKGWVRITLGTNVGEIRLISDYAQSSTTITVNFAFTGQVDSAVTFELHRFHPQTKLNSIDRALQELYPRNGNRGLYLSIIDETLVVDNLLANAGFQTAVSGGASPSWTNVGTPTVEDETTIVRHGARSVKITSSGAAEGIEQYLAPVSVKEITGKSVTVKFWVYATVASLARIRLDWDGSNFENSEYHSGDDQWELLFVTATVPASATQLKVRLEVADVSPNIGYFDAGWCVIANAPVQRYTIPTTIITGPYKITEQGYEDRPDGPYYSYAPYDGPTAGRILRLQGMSELSQPTTDAGTTEIGEPRVNLVTAKANEILFRTMSFAVSGDTRERYLAQRAEWAEEAERLMATPGIAMPRVAADLVQGVWHTEEDSAGRYVVFDTYR